MISAVIPVYNEKDSLITLSKLLVPELLKIDKQYEIIFVDDGSTDESLKILKEQREKNKQIRIFSFRRNQGKAEALTLGFQMTKGDFIVTLDADLQDDSAEINKLLEKAKEGYDLVCGWRKDRKDKLQKQLSSKLFNFLANIFWGLKLHDYNCGLKVYSKEAAKSLHLYGGFHRFIPLLVYQQGFRVTEVPVIHRSRKFGKSKYGFSKLWKDLPDIFTMLFLTRYRNKPMHFFGTVGGILLVFGVFILIYLSILHFQGHAIGTRPLLDFGILLVLTGFQIVLTGFLADLFIHLSEKNHDPRTLRYSADD